MSVPVAARRIQISPYVGNVTNGFYSGGGVSGRGTCLLHPALPCHGGSVHKVQLSRALGGFFESEDNLLRLFHETLLLLQLKANILMDV